MSGTKPGYWDARARLEGPIAVVKQGYSDEEAKRVTEQWWQALEPAWRLLHPGMRLLDFGCGFGRWHNHLRPLVREYLGADVSKVLLEHARAQNPEGTFLKIDPCVLPFGPAHFDAVWCVTVLQHLSDEDATRSVAEIQRVLRPGGLLILVENTTVRPPSPHVVFRAPERYSQLFSRVALEVVGNIQEGDETMSVMVGRRLEEELAARTAEAGFMEEETQPI